MSERYDSEMYRLGEENLKLNRELRAERAEYHAYKTGVEKEKILKANESDCDIAHVEGLIDGGKPRVVDGKVIISFGPDESMTGTLDDAMQFWRSKPESYGNIIGITKPKEPSAQDLHNQKLMKMTPEQYNAYRKRRGRDYMTPEE